MTNMLLYIYVTSQNTIVTTSYGYFRGQLQITRNNSITDDFIDKQNPQINCIYEPIFR